MYTLLTVVEPIATPLNTQFYGLVAIAFIGAVLCFLLMTRRLAASFKLAGLFGMLLGFAGLISAGAVVFSYVHARNIQAIKFNKTELRYSNEIIQYNQIQGHYVKPLMQQSRYSAQITTDTALVYVIETRDKRSHLFSDDYYDMRTLKKVMDEYVPK